MTRAVRVMPNMNLDVLDVLYDCGHTITIPGSHMAKHGAHAYPVSCPTCLSTGMTQKWVDQEEAKLWNSDPKWGGFPPVQPGAVIPISHGASVSYTQFAPKEQPLPTMSSGPLAWLDFQVQSVSRRAFN